MTGPQRRAFRYLYLRAAPLLLAASFVFAAAPARAQSHWPSGTVGHLVGQDISTEGGVGGPIVGATSLFITSGSVITVHSGEARLELEGGGMVDICGPAKFTLLAAGGAYTLALNFGRVHVMAPEATSIRVYSPFLVITPVGVGGEDHDLTVGLEVNDTICLYAAHGAARLEQQLGGESLMIPQSGEFNLAGEKLDAVTDAGGTCRCSVYHAAVTTVEPASPSVAAPAPSPAPTEKIPADAGASVPPSGVPASSVPATVNEAASLSTKSAISIPSPPEVAPPVWNVIMPALVFSAASPPPPEDYTAMTELIRDARVSPNWVFTGRVQERARGAENEAQKTPKSTTGFWSRVKRFLFGGPRPNA